MCAFSARIYVKIEPLLQPATYFKATAALTRLKQEKTVILLTSVRLYQTTLMLEVGVLDYLRSPGAVFYYLIGEGNM